jgi:START domain
LGGGKRQIFHSLISQSNPTLLVAGKSSASYFNNHQDKVFLSRGGEQQHVAVLKQISKVPFVVVSKFMKNIKPPKNVGQYYGLEPDKIFPYHSKARQKGASEVVEQQVAMSQTLSETLVEMRIMRKELQTLRREMYEMRKRITGEQDLEFEGLAVEEEDIDPEVVRLAQQKRQRYFDRLGREIEKWARQKLFEEDRVGNGWVEIECNKVVSKNGNANGRTKVYLTWMKDSRGKNAFPDDHREYPCIKVYSCVDAPLENVCTYLSREENMPDYNVILTAQKDLEEIAPHAKICWATSPQILFVKPREFVTFACHRWLKDGSVVMLNQAVDHKDAPAVTEEGKGKTCRGYALRGATFFSPDPQDDQKTRIAMIAHAAPGGDLPQWVSACSALVCLMIVVSPGMSH